MWKSTNQKNSEYGNFLRSDVLRQKGLYQVFLWYILYDSYCQSIWGRVFKNGQSKVCGRQYLKKFTWSILEYFVQYILTATDTDTLIFTTTDIVS